MKSRKNKLGKNRKPRYFYNICTCNNSIVYARLEDFRSYLCFYIIKPHAKKEFWVNVLIAILLCIWGKILYAR